MSSYFAFVNICFIFMLFSITLPVFSCGNNNHRSSEAHNGKKPPRLQKGRLGVVSAEKLGCGMTAIAKFEWNLDVTGGNPQQPRE